MKKKPWQQLDKYYNDIIGDDFLQAAKYFRKLQDEAPETFASVAKHCGIDRRTTSSNNALLMKFGPAGVRKLNVAAPTRCVPPMLPRGPGGRFPLL